LKLLEIFTILPFYVCVWGNPFSSSFVQWIIIVLFQVHQILSCSANFHW
jgi:hypothetical protein